MLVLQARRRFHRLILLVFFLGLMGALTTAAQEIVSVTEISPQVLVFATSTGNVVASVGPDGALLIGTPSAASTAPIEAILATHTKSPVRYVVIAPEDPSSPKATQVGDGEAHSWPCRRMRSAVSEATSWARRAGCPRA
jgi:hypothetical protein